MIEVKVKEADIKKAVSEGMDAFVAVFVNGIKDAIGGELTAETMAQLTPDQITLLAWDYLHNEVSFGGKENSSRDLSASATCYNRLALSPTLLLLETHSKFYLGANED